MRSKREIENQLAHFRTNCGNAGSEENAIWIAALEWVLGDKEHQAAYNKFVASIRDLAPLQPIDETYTPMQRMAAIAAHMALERIE